MKLKIAVPKRKHVSKIDFAVAWESSNTISEAAQRVGLGERAASVKASSLRNQGYNLKCFPRLHKDRISPKALNVVINKIHFTLQKAGPQAAYAMGQKIKTRLNGKNGDGKP